MTERATATRCRTRSFRGCSGNILFAWFVSLVIVPQLVQSQVFPTTSLKLVSAGAAGSVPDILARQIAEKFAATLRQSVFVENRPGAGGIVAMETVARAKPDGHTIGVAAISQMVFNEYLFERLPYEPLRDLAPVIKLVSGRVAITANPSFPGNTLGELIDLAKASPSTIDYAVPQLGAPPHIFALQLARAAHIEMVAVPFRSAQDALASVVGGSVPVSFEGAQLTAPLVKAGRLKALAIIGHDRDPLLPDTPTVAELGLQLRDEAWIGLVVPAATPMGTIAVINSAANRALNDADLKRQLIALGWRVEGGTSDAFDASIRSEQITWGQVIRQSGLRLH